MKSKKNKAQLGGKHMLKGGKTGKIKYTRKYNNECA